MSSLPYFSSIIAQLRKERDERKFSFQKFKLACRRGQEQKGFHKRHPLSTEGIAGVQNTPGCRQGDSVGIYLPDHCKLPQGLLLVSTLRVLTAPEVAREGRAITPQDQPTKGAKTRSDSIALPTSPPATNKLHRPASGP